jgi:hypothetical protein
MIPSARVLVRPLKRVLRVAPLVIISACGALAGIDDFAVAPAADAGEVDANATRLVPGRCGRFEYAAATCAKCIDDKCCMQASECRGNATCAPLLECLDRCPPENGRCRYACWKVHPKTDHAVAELYRCEYEKCPSACSTCGAEWDSSGEACGDCMREHGCCEESLACQSDPECRAYLTCLLEHCGSSLRQDPGCQLLCETTHPQGAALQRRSDGAISCAFFNGCGYSECGWGTHWDCVEHYDWPSPTSDKADARIHVAPVSANGSPVPLDSATVTACQLLPDFTCAPLTRGVTDANGDVTLPGLSLPFPSLAPSSGSGYLLIEHESLPKALIFLGAPIVSGQHLDAGYLFTRSFADTAISNLNIRRDPTRGAIFAHIKDCRGSFPICATLSDGAAGSAGPYYYQGFLPDLSAQCTDKNGIGLFLNVPTGRPVRIEAKLGGALVAWADVIAEAGTTTSVTLYPYQNRP